AVERDDAGGVYCSCAFLLFGWWLVWHFANPGGTWRSLQVGKPRWDGALLAIALVSADYGRVPSRLSLGRAALLGGPRSAIAAAASLERTRLPHVGQGAIGPSEPPHGWIALIRDDAGQWLAFVAVLERVGPISHERTAFARAGFDVFAGQL